MQHGDKTLDKVDKRSTQTKR